MLPDSFKRNILTLQEAILRSAPTRAGQAATRETVAAANDPLPVTESRLDALRDAVSAGAQQSLIQQIGTQLFEFAFQRKVRELYSNATTQQFGIERL